MSVAVPSDCSIEVDSIDEHCWNELLKTFRDANIYQTLAHEAARSSPNTASHLLVRRGGVVIAAAQARIAKIPFAAFGVAYVRWGPMWRRIGTETDHGCLALVLKAMRKEYVLRRGLLLRVLPYAFDEECPSLSSAFSKESFTRVHSEPAQRTLVMSIDRPLHEIRRGLHQKWRNCLNRAERNSLEVDEGYGDELFAMFARIYADMHARKRFAEASDVDHFRRVEVLLPKDLKSWIAIARHRGELAAGLVVSRIGETGVFLLAATTNSGMESKASYLLQWRALEWLQQSHARFYNLNGINPTSNPGTYHFKSGLCGKNGRDVRYMGVHDCTDGAAMARVVQLAAEARRVLRQTRSSLRRSQNSES